MQVCLHNSHSVFSYYFVFIMDFPLYTVFFPMIFLTRFHTFSLELCTTYQPLAFSMSMFYYCTIDLMWLFLFSLHSTVLL